jgi:hypothetical protein
MTGDLPPRTTGDIGEAYPSVDDAAIAACRWLWKNVPEARRAEFAGCLYRTSAGEIRVGLPATKGDPGFCMTPRPPAGTELVGDYHNHTTVLTFSELDLNTRQRTPFYLCVPDESVLKHDPTTGNTRKIGP